jgi:predicted transcriptional regulator
LWQEAAATMDFGRILTRQNLKLHVQYPANHFFGLALNLASVGGLMPDFRDQCLRRLRDQALSEIVESPTRLTDRHHAIHILARFGSLDDQAIISEIMANAAKSTEPASIRHAFTGLSLQPGCEALVEKYLYLLQKDEVLAYIDLAFDAVHYGDGGLAPGQELPRDLHKNTKTIANLLRRLTQPDLYSKIRELDTFRLCVLLDREEQCVASSSSLSPAMKFALEQALMSNRNRYTAEAQARLERILDPIGKRKAS